MGSCFEWNFERRFGVEIELITTNGVIESWGRNVPRIPEGASTAARAINAALKEQVLIRHYGHYDDPNAWVVKPDSSCGMEVCSPPLKGKNGMDRLVRAIDSLRNKDMKVDERCSFHVHIDVHDLDEIQLASVIAHYIKCEHLIFDALPNYRKTNRYCQFIGVLPSFDDGRKLIPREIISRVSNSKYYSANCYHFAENGFKKDAGRCTIEFRVGGHELCTNSNPAKNWVLFLLHFVEMTKDRPLPAQATSEDRWSGFFWLDPQDMVQILGWDQPLSEDLQYMRNWFFGRIWQNIFVGTRSGIWMNRARAKACYDWLKCESMSGPDMV